MSEHALGKDTICKQNSNREFFEVKNFTSFETSETSYPTTQRNITDDSYLQQQRCENPKSRRSCPHPRFNHCGTKLILPVLKHLSPIENALHCHQADRLLLDTVKFEREPLVANYCYNGQKEMKHPIFQLHGNIKRIHRHEREFWGLRTPFNGVAVKAHVIPLWVTRVDLSRSMTEGLGE